MKYIQNDIKEAILDYIFLKILMNINLLCILEIYFYIEFLFQTFLKYVLNY